MRRTCCHLTVGQRVRIIGALSDFCFAQAYCHQLEWPLRSRKYEYGVYTDQVLQVYFPPANAVLTNIARG